MTGQRWYRTADDQVVPEGHPDAVQLIAGEADELPAGYSLPKGAKVVKEEEPEPEAEKPGVVVKKAAPAANKQRAKSSDK